MTVGADGEHEAGEAGYVEPASLLERENRLMLLARIAAGQVLEPRVVEGQVVRIEPAVRDRTRALELLGKAHGDFVEVIDQKVRGEDGVPVEVRIVDVPRADAIAIARRRREDER